MRALDSLPTNYIPPKELSDLREKIRRRAFLVRQNTKLKVKIRDIFAYEGVKPPTGHCLFTKKGVDWLRGLSMEPVDCYLRLMAPLSREVHLLSKELRVLAKDDPDVQPLMTIHGVGYYVALLIKAEVGDINRFTSGDHVASYAGLVPSTRSSTRARRRMQAISWLRLERRDIYAFIQAREDKSSSQPCAC